MCFISLQLCALSFLFTVKISRKLDNLICISQICYSLESSANSSELPLRHFLIIQNSRNFEVPLSFYRRFSLFLQCQTHFEMHPGPINFAANNVASSHSLLPVNLSAKSTQIFNLSDVVIEVTRQMRVVYSARQKIFAKVTPRFRAAWIYFANFGKVNPRDTAKL